MQRVDWRGAIGALALSLILAGGAGFAPPAFAQHIAPEIDPYDDVVHAMLEGLDRSAEIDATLDAMRREYRATPVMAKLEKQSPGLIDELVEAARPVIEASLARNSNVMNTEIAALFRANLTVSEAAEAARFFRNPSVKRLLGNVSRNYSPDNIASGIGSDAPITVEQVTKDAQNASAKGVMATSKTDLAVVEKLGEESPVWRKLKMLLPQIREIRTRIENAPLTAEEDAILDAAIDKIFARRFPEN